MIERLLRIRDSLTQMVDHYEEISEEQSPLNHLTDEEVEDMMLGSAMWDDPPPEWDHNDLVKWSRGYIDAEAKCFYNFQSRLKRVLDRLDEVLEDADGATWSEGAGSRPQFRNFCLGEFTGPTTKVELKAQMLAYQYHVDKECIDQRFQSRSGAKSFPEGLHPAERSRWERAIMDRRKELFCCERLEHRVPTEMLQKAIFNASRERDRHSPEWMEEQLDHLKMVISHRENQDEEAKCESTESTIQRTS